MKVYAVLEDDKLVSLCTESIAANTLQAELYYGYGGVSSSVQEAEIDESVWQQIERLAILHAAQE